MKTRTTLIMLAITFFIIFNFGCTVEEKQGPDTIKEIQKKRLLSKVGQKYSDADGHYKLGKIYASEKQWDKALYEYDVALSVDPSHWKTQAAKLKALVSKGQKQKADVAAEVYINQTVGNIEGALNLSKALEEEGLDSYVERSYKVGMVKFPDSPQLNKGLGLYYLKKGNNEGAIKYLSESFRLDPSQSDIARELGKIGVRVERPESKLGKSSNSK